MKTRHQAAITMEQVTPGPSCSKKSAALTSSRAVKASEASNLQQGTIHLDIKEKDRCRKKLKAMDLKEAEKY